MRKFLLLTTLAVAAVVAGGIAVQAQTYGPGMMGNGPDNAGRRGNYGMMDGGYGSGSMMGGSAAGPGMMDYGSAEGVNGRGAGYRGKRLCWKDTDSARGYGYYAPCGI